MKYLALLLLASCAACAAFAGDVLVDPLDLPIGTPAVETVLPVNDTGRFYVIVSEDNVPSGVVAVPLDDVSRSPTEGPSPLGQLGAMLGPWGALGGYLAAKLLASKRARTNAGAGIKALLTGHIPTAAKKLAAADGWAHSTPESKIAAEEST
jgi:hypothetical protein